MTNIEDEEKMSHGLTNIAIAHDSIIANCTVQTHYANRYRSAEEPLKEGDLVYLFTKILNLPKHRAQNSCRPLSDRTVL